MHQCQWCWCGGFSLLGQLQCCACSEAQEWGEEFVHAQLCQCSSCGQPVFICVPSTKQISAGGTWGVQTFTIESKAWDLTLSLPRCSLFPSWQWSRGVLNSRSHRMQGSRASRLREYLDTISWILNGWASMVCLREARSFATADVFLLLFAQYPGEKESTKWFKARIHLQIQYKKEIRNVKGNYIHRATPWCFTCIFALIANPEGRQIPSAFLCQDRGAASITVRRKTAALVLPIR